MDEAGLLSVVCSGRTRSSGLKLEHGKSHTNMQKKFFMVRMTEHWNRLPREVVEYLYMEIFKTWLDVYLCNLLKSTCYSRGVGLDLLRSFPIPVIL